jgi:hypothetical protein
MQSCRQMVTWCDRVTWSRKVKHLLAKAVQMQHTTGLQFEECLESLEAIRKQIGEFSLRGANDQLYQLILSHRQAGYTPRRAALRALQDAYIWDYCIKPNQYSDRHSACA